jgi:hypothetical protein
MGIFLPLETQSLYVEPRQLQDKFIRLQSFPPLPTLKTKETCTLRRRFLLVTAAL